MASCEAASAPLTAPTPGRGGAGAGERRRGGLRAGCQPPWGRWAGSGDANTGLNPGAGGCSRQGAAGGCQRSLPLLRPLPSLLSAPGALRGANGPCARSAPAPRHPARQRPPRRGGPAAGKGALQSRSACGETLANRDASLRSCAADNVSHPCKRGFCSCPSLSTTGPVPWVFFSTRRFILCH